MTTTEDNYSNYLTDETMDEMDSNEDVWCWDCNATCPAECWCGEDDEPVLDFGFEHDSAMTSAGWGTDEDYGFYGEDAGFGDC